ncbi:hypothetical protein F66182_2461 [Fusarium sp. NRRL 66182]|nr:hypothetical protein F66182_2461 [Fusarium sp. NRRL 66182]
MPSKTSSSLGRSTRPKPPVVSSKFTPRKPPPTSTGTFGPSTKPQPRPTTPHGSSAFPPNASLKPSPSVGGSAQRSRSHEAASRRPRYPPTSSPRHSYYGAPKRRDTNERPLSPRARPSPPKPLERNLGRRMTRDAEMSEDETRPPSRRRSPSPRYRHRSDRTRPPVHDTKPWPSAPKTSTSTRPPMRSYATDSTRPDPTRRPSYEPQRPSKYPPSAGRRSPPPGYRPAAHLAAEMLRGRPQSRGQSPLRNHEAAHSVDGEKRPSKGGAAKAQAMPKKPPTRHTDQQKEKPDPKPAEDEPPKKGHEFLRHLPQAFGTYAGVEKLGEHADTAKEWADWFMNLQKTPEEIHALSAKATTAKDTITQIQNTLAARPDIIDGNDALPMRKQIDAAIENAMAALDKMTKLLEEMSSHGLEGTRFEGLQEFYNSYRYKDEWEEKIKAADADLEKQLSALSTLVVTIYSRALMKPAPPGFNKPVPPPAPGTSSVSTDARQSPPEHGRPKSRARSPELDPPPVGKHRKSLDIDADESVHPDSASEQKDDTAKSSTAEEKPEAAEEHNDNKKPDNDSDIKTPSAEAPTEFKVKIDADSKVPQVSAQDATEPKEQNSNDSHPKEDSTGIKPTQPTPADDLEDVLLDAAWNGDIQACHDALQNASPLTRDQQGLTPLHLAAERDHLAIAMLLLDRGADSNARANGGRTPLHLAARYGSAAIVEFLVDDGRADPNARTTDGRTALHYAASAAEDGDQERRDVIRVLRDWRADPTIEDNKGRTAREVAQKRDYWDVSSTLRRAEKKWEEEHHPSWLQRHGLKR